MSERETFVAEQIAQAERERADALHRAEDLKKKTQILEVRAQELEVAIRYLKEYQARLGLGKTLITITDIPHHGSKNAIGIRSLTHQYLLMTTEFSYVDLYKYISEYITEPNDRSVRAELSYNKSRDAVERIGPSHYRSLIAGADAGPANPQQLMPGLDVNEGDEEDFEEIDPLAETQED